MIQAQQEPLDAVCLYAVNLGQEFFIKSDTLEDKVRKITHRS